MRELFPKDRPVLVLAPMQDVTDLPFMRLMASYGGPDIYVTEYFRVTAESKLDGNTLRSITENDTGRPVLAQMIGQDIPALVRTAKLLGHQYLVVPSLPSETKRSINAWKIWADRFNVAGEEARRAGIWLAFHNEPDHLRKVEGEIPLDVFLARTEPKFVRFQLDVGNMLMGGGDPMDYLNRYKDRIGTFHLKNVVADRKTDTELGAGTFDLRAFLAAVPELGGTITVRYGNLDYQTQATATSADYPLPAARPRPEPAAREG